MTDYTVLVLGAGASLPYGLPLGKGLLNEICNLLPDSFNGHLNSKAETLYNEIVGSNEFMSSWQTMRLKDPYHALVEFNHRLKESDPKSIDEFLSRDFGKANDAFQIIGKAAIANVIASNESPFGTNFEAKIEMDHWYRYLWQYCLNDGCQNYDAVKAKKIRIISFNYDRSLEYYLGRKLAATYFSPPGTIFGIDKVGKWANIGFTAIETDFSITHPYGTLGSLTRIPYGGANNHRDFGKEMSSNIKVIGEDRSDIDSFSKAREWLATAKTIVFLGFSFDQTNMERLGLAKGLTRAIHERKENPFRKVNPMTYGFERAERNTLINKYFSDFNGHESTAAIQEQHYDKSAPITHYLRSYGGLTEL
jgi:hypothetical protein